MTAQATDTPTTEATPAASDAGTGGEGAQPAAGAEGASASAKGSSKTSVLGDVGESGVASNAPAGKSTEGDPKPGDAVGELVLTLPEGVEANADQVAAFTAIATENKLSNEQFSALAAWDVQRQQEAEAAAVKAWEDRDAAYVKALQSDPDIGGDKLEASVVAAKSALRKFGGEQLAKDLAELGIGNLPSLVKTFASLGLADAEDNSGGSDGGGGAERTREQRLADLYDKSQPGS